MTNTAAADTAAREDEFSRITDAALQQLRGMIGHEIRRGRPYVEELNADAIRHYAHGIGDRNPLWFDPDYAAASVHGTLLAPPSILFATSQILSGYVMGLPGIHAMFAGTEFRFERPLRLGDRVRPLAKLKDVIERPGRFAGRSIQQIYEVAFYDQQDERIATAESYCFRTERDEARKRGKYRAHAIRWTPDQIAAIATQYREQDTRRRGRSPRYLEQVTPGDDVPAIIKGPYTATTAVAYLLGWGGLYVRAHGDAFDLFDRHPALGIPNRLGVPEPPERVHWDTDLAQRVGVPDAYDYGPERVSWMGHLVTDWMGDAGFLKRLRVEVRRHNLLGELVTLTGRVLAVDTSAATVKLHLEAHNQDGEESARGEAEVILPRAPGNT